MNNKVNIAGEIKSIEYSHKSHGENFFQTILEVARKSWATDSIPVLVSERILKMDDSMIGSYAIVSGRLHSHNVHEPNRTWVSYNIFAEEIEIKYGLALEEIGLNSVTLDGYICKETSYRTTPNGREICDFFMAVHRTYPKSDYIPCIAWGRNAKYMGDMEVGKHIEVTGRLQSREYVKRLETEDVTRIAYEVSVQKFSEVEDEQDN